MGRVTLETFLKRLGVEEPDYEIGLTLDSSVDRITKYFVTRVSDSIVRISLTSKRHPAGESHEGWLYPLTGTVALMGSEMYAVEWVLVREIKVPIPIMRIRYNRP